MPAPTALKAPPPQEEDATAFTNPAPEISLDDAAADEQADPSAQQPTNDDDNMQLDNDGVDEEGRPRFAPAAKTDVIVRVEHRKVAIPPHRMTPLKAAWPKIYPPLVEHLRLQCRMNMKSKAVELRTSRATTDTGAIQKGADFVRAFALGFEVDDAIALLRLDDLYIESKPSLFTCFPAFLPLVCLHCLFFFFWPFPFALGSLILSFFQPAFEIKDVKTLQGDHLARAIGRIAGKDGKTKYAIENASRTRIVLADSKIHILGGFKNTRIARESVVSLILGKPPGKVYNGLRTVSARMKERF